MPEPAVIPGVVTMTCPACNAERNAADFLALPMDKRCSYCLPVAAMEEVEEKKLALIQQRLARFNDVTKGDVVDVPKFKRFLSCLIRDGGGINEITRRFWRCMDALEKKGSHGAVVQYTGSMMKLWLQEERLDHDRDVAAMTSEQLRDEKRMLLISMLADLAKDKAGREVVEALIEAANLPRTLLPAASLPIAVGAACEEAASV